MMWRALRNRSSVMLDHGTYLLQPVHIRRPGGGMITQPYSSITKPDVRILSASHQIFPGPSIPVLSVGRLPFPLARSFASGGAFGGPRGGPRDIGARARAAQTRRLWSLVAGGSVVAGFVILMLNSFQESLMFYITPTQALDKFSTEPAKSRFRLGGLVLEGSVKHFTNSTETEFVVTDLATDILVRYRGSLPDLFREGHSVVAEGYLKPWQLEAMTRVALAEGRVDEEGTVAVREDVSKRARELDCFFAASEVLAKHDEKYMPQEVAAAVEKNRAALKEAEGESGGDSEGGVVLNRKAGGQQPPSKSNKLSKIGQAPARAAEYDIQ